MDRYPLAPLLSVREYREENAKNAVRAAEAAVREAEAEVTKRQESLENYRIWRVEEEERRYDSIMDATLTLEELDEFKAGLASLKNRELKLEESVVEAVRQVEQCRKAVEKARQEAVRARKDVSKILAHKDIWMEEAKKEAARLEDLELEEFKPLPPQGAENDDE